MMAALNTHIILAGTPSLRKPSKTIPIKDLPHPSIHALIEHMFECMKEKNGVGLAAIQIGVPLKVIVYGFEQNSRYPGEAAIEQQALINAEIIAKSNKLLHAYEGCLSLPTVRGEVSRHEWIEIQAFDQNAKLIQKRVSGFEARILQHEIDHTNGLLFLDRMSNLKTLGITSALKEAGIIP